MKVHTRRAAYPLWPVRLVWLSRIAGRISLDPTPAGSLHWVEIAPRGDGRRWWRTTLHFGHLKIIFGPPR